VPALATPERRLRPLLVLADGAVAVLAALAAIEVRFRAADAAAMRGELLGHPWFVVTALLAVWLVAATCDLYHTEFWTIADRLLVRLLAFAGGVSLAVIVMVYAVPSWRFGRGLLALTLAFTVLGLGLVRVAWLRLARSWPAPPALALGEGPVLERLRRELATRPLVPFRIVGRVEHERLAELADGRDGTPPYLVTDVLHAGAEALELVHLNFRGVSVVDATTVYAELTGRIPSEGVDPRWFLASGGYATLATTSWHVAQRILDVALAASGLVVGLPLAVAGALAVWLTDGGPVLYRQKRLGRFRRPFRLYKLRTMRRDAERDGPRLASLDDPRVLRVGRLLRRWRIDEIPQLVNVLRGEMSLVGPRPERPEIAERLEEELAYYAFRYSVRPGLTGWAQVNRPYCEEPEHQREKLEYDLYYLRHVGPWMYALVLVRTLGSLLFRRGW